MVFRFLGLGFYFKVPGVLGLRVECFRVYVSA